MRKQEKVQVTLSMAAQKALLSDACQRQHIEACGLLTGTIDDQGNWHVQQVHPLRNIFDSPVYFEFAPEDILAVELAFPGQVIGVYHSHPGGLRTASSTDRGNMRRVNVEEQIPWVWLILSGPFNCAPSLTSSSIIAYHHYKHEGLRQITIALAGGAATIQQEGSDTYGHLS